MNLLVLGAIQNLLYHIKCFKNLKKTQEMLKNALKIIRKVLKMQNTGFFGVRKEL